MSSIEDQEDPKVMAISGASGMVGSALSKAAAQKGWSVIPMVRRRDLQGIYWSVEDDEIDVEALQGVDAVVHLAGENIAGSRWNKAHKRAIKESREKGTQLVAEAIAELEEPPAVFICASAVGYYGHTGDEWVDESSASGEGFLAEVCRCWEAACEPARRVACRVVNARLAMIISPDGGALEKMLLPFQLGVGGRLGDGTQFMSWVSLEDVVRALLFAIEEAEIDGALNVTSPNPVTNAEFTDALGKVLGRPTLLPVPAAMLKLAVGAQMADEMLLRGQRVKPKKLLESGFGFEHRELSDALGWALQ